MKEIYVLGGNGFLGSAFVRFFEKLNLPYQVITRMNYSEFQGSSCHIFLNVNGNSKKYLADTSPMEDFDASTRSVYKSLHEFKHDHYIYCSSCDVYSCVSEPEKNHEDSYIDTSNISRYGFHKYLAEQGVIYESKSHLILRFGGFVGPGLKKNAIYDITEGGILYLNPESRLQFMETDYAAKMVWEMVRMEAWGETFNVCGAGLICLRDVIEMSGKSVTLKPESPTVTYDISISKIKKVMPVQSSREAISLYIGKMMQNYELMES